MGRPLRSDVDTWFHVVNRGLDRSVIFHDDRDRVEFERLLGLAHDRLGIEVHAFCWMSNHFHLLVRCAEGRVLSEAMHLVGSLYVRHFNDRYERDGPLFKDRFFAKAVRDDAYFLRLVRYIHRNPLAIAGVLSPIDHRWSSLRVFAGHRTRPLWMRTDTVLELCGGRDAVVELSLSDRNSVAPISTDSLPDAIALARWLLPDASAHVRGDRTLAALLLEELDPDRRRALARQLDFPSDDAQRQAVQRARRKAARSPEVGELMSEVRRLAA